ncbi:putative lipid II flippase FtsW [Spirochaeta africana]|uniref:Probable peptidoglycan glycosyltransferase FtsW n=1 Tax=Spirochaeta africana (strain ATCC 700263 / DSM 8902 / Z-7692) TaxID=889378 RepID=H9UKX4_SPIAZ|nr:putative lipid II flippase FtsW [Spirochaeta africana]AFG38167.1 cell division protein FtsW [Spirochaeta africana DSM 8902]
MSNVFVIETAPSRRFDRPLIFVTLLLVGVGLTMLFSVSYSRADALFQNPFYFVQRQALLMLVGIVGALVLSRIDLRIIERVIPYAVVFNMLLLLLTFIPQLGATYLGARRWIVLFGFSFQPSELVKLTLVLYLSCMLGRKQDRFDDPVNTLLPPLMMTGLVAGLVYLQNDFSTTVFIVVIAGLIFYAAGVKLRYFVSLFIMAVPLLTILILSREHRVNRIISFIEPALDPRGSGYQVLMSQTALQTGGLWGRGIGMGRYKFGLLPEAHSDFLFAIVGEELGYLGVLAVLAMFLYLGYRGFLIARSANYGVVRLAAFGLSGVLMYQALLNMAVVAGMLPATGITLPFFSSGGTSAMVSLWICGALLNLSRYTEHDAGGERG